MKRETYQNGRVACQTKPFQLGIVNKLNEIAIEQRWTTENGLKVETIRCIFQWSGYGSEKKNRSLQ